jgi:putative tryptophan/tyrosine transport system substrate-binding protein
MSDVPGGFPHRPGMDRRRFLLTSLAGALAAPLGAGAQQAGKVYRIGQLTFTAEPSRSQEERAQLPFVRALGELGWVEGQNLAFEDRRSPTVAQLDSLAAELVNLKVDVIYTGGTPAIRAAKRATSSIPIVMIVGVDPVPDGLVASLPRPGGNITGITALSSELIEKRLGLISEVIPRGSRVAYMWNPTNPGNVSAWEQTKKVAPMIGVNVLPVPVSGADELDGAFARMAKERIGGFLVGADGMLVAHRTRLAELALKHSRTEIGPADGYVHRKSAQAVRRQRAHAPSAVHRGPDARAGRRLGLMPPDRRLGARRRDGSASCESERDGHDRHGSHASTSPRSAFEPHSVASTAPSTSRFRPPPR